MPKKMTKATKQSWSAINAPLLNALPQIGSYVNTIVPTWAATRDDEQYNSWMAIGYRNANKEIVAARRSLAKVKARLRKDIDARAIGMAGLDMDNVVKAVLKCKRIWSSILQKHRGELSEYNKQYLMRALDRCARAGAAIRAWRKAARKAHAYAVGRRKSSKATKATPKQILSRVLRVVMTAQQRAVETQRRLEKDSRGRGSGSRASSALRVTESALRELERGRRKIDSLMRSLPPGEKERKRALAVAIGHLSGAQVDLGAASIYRGDLGRAKVAWRKVQLAIDMLFAAERMPGMYKATRKDFARAFNRAATSAFDAATESWGRAQRQEAANPGDRTAANVNKQVYYVRRWLNEGVLPLAREMSIPWHYDPEDVVASVRAFDRKIAQMLGRLRPVSNYNNDDAHVRVLIRKLGAARKVLAAWMRSPNVAKVRKHIKASYGDMLPYALRVVKAATEAALQARRVTMVQAQRDAEEGQHDLVMRQWAEDSQGTNALQGAEKKMLQAVRFKRDHLMSMRLLKDTYQSLRKAQLEYNKLVRKYPQIRPLKDVVRKIKLAMAVTEKVYAKGEKESGGRRLRRIM